MKNLLLYIFTFIIVYLFYLIFVMSRKSVLKKFPDGMNMSYLKYKYGIKINDKNLKSIANTVFLANSFILSTTVYIVCLFDNFILGIVVGIIPLILLILILYHLIGIYYKNKQGGK